MVAGWISFKLAVLRMAPDKYGVYMTHLEEVKNQSKCCCTFLFYCFVNPCCRVIKGFPGK